MTFLLNDVIEFFISLTSDWASGNSTTLAFQFLWTWFTSVLTADLAFSCSSFAFAEVDIWTEFGVEFIFTHTTETTWWGTTWWTTSSSTTWDWCTSTEFLKNYEIIGVLRLIKNLPCYHSSILVSLPFQCFGRKVLRHLVILMGQHIGHRMMYRNMR